jgi:carbamoyl-phosphate synthase large subunit
LNVLLTCAGRRGFLVRYFCEALAGRGEVIACDSSEHAPALQEADRSFVVPAIDRPDYFDVLRSLCRQHEVRLLIPINDLELLGLAERADDFRAGGTIVMISSPGVISMCQDKWAAYEFMKARGIPTPDTYRSIAAVRAALAESRLRFPVLLKPRWGTTSIGIELAENNQQLELAHEWGRIQLQRSFLAKLGPADAANAEDCFVFQPRLEGHEYGIDVVNDLTGRHVCTLARRKLVMRAGNTDRAVTVDEPELDRLGGTLGRELAHVGSLDADVMVTDDGGWQVLDLNPRLGGGYPFSHLAGANLPAALVAWANGEEPDPAWLRSRAGVASARVDELAALESGGKP